MQKCIYGEPTFQEPPSATLDSHQESPQGSKEICSSNIKEKKGSPLTPPINWEYKETGNNSRLVENAFSKI